MLDVVNERLTIDGKIQITFDHDCHEGICGSCGLVLNGVPHGPQPGTTTCQLHMRHFKDRQVIVIEPLRARDFPMIRDLIVNRSYRRATMVARSSNLLAYPHSLSYHATSFTKVGSSCMPALASNTEVQDSPRKSVETTSSSV